ncbi:unnamed protein product [Spodoptera littoralis]|uniref:Uncharacterized protein n=1 Tax=Spodoptera littoralis TaxID=7109 RepID=A0A9P0I3H3_SPOLI|nr:unnamed protein product [Spodoptera littoralis]CAH1640666.1 unnamed protein product [Spodoptera littoralis]
MFVYLLLLLPRVEAGDLDALDHSVREIKDADVIVSAIISILFPDDGDDLNKDTVRLDEDNSPEYVKEGFIRPYFDNVGQTRFKKIKTNGDPKKYNLRDNTFIKMNARSEPDTLLLLNKLVLRLSEVMSPEIKAELQSPAAKHQLMQLVK